MGLRAPARSKNPALAGRVLGAQTSGPCGGTPVLNHCPCRLVTSPRTGGEKQMATRNTRQTGSKAASAASKVLSNPKSSKAAKSAAASALSQTPKSRKK